MASELNMYESQVVEHKMDIDRLQRELQEVKKKYYLQKKKDHQQRLAYQWLLVDIHRSTQQFSKILQRHSKSRYQCHVLTNQSNLCETHA